MFCQETVPGEKLHLQEQTQNHSIGHELCSIGNWLKYSEATCYTIRGTHQGSHHGLSLTNHLLHHPACSKQIGLVQPFIPWKHRSCCPAQGMVCPACASVASETGRMGHTGREPSDTLTHRAGHGSWHHSMSPHHRPLARAAQSPSQGTWGAWGTSTCLWFQGLRARALCKRPVPSPHLT